MIFQKTKPVKSVFLPLTFAVLLLMLGGLLLLSCLFYNQKRGGVEEAKAQGATGFDLGVVCDGDEIPLGEVIEEAIQMGGAIEDNFSNIIEVSSRQIEAANQLSLLPEQCTSDNCTTNCHEHTTTNPDGTTSTHCDRPNCSGNACPWSAISSKVTQIQNFYKQIDDSKKIIDANIAKRPDLIEKLEEVRVALAECVTPFTQDLKEVEINEAKTLLTCQEAKYQRALPSGKESCIPNNLFCCYFRPR